MWSISCSKVELPMEGTEEPISRPGRCQSEVCVKPSSMEIAVVNVARHASTLATESFIFFYCLQVLEERV